MNVNKPVKPCRLNRILAILVFVLFPLLAFSQMKKVEGIIKDEQGESIIGAFVKVVGTTLGTASDVDGHFTIEVPMNSNQLEISYLGYETSLVPISGNQPLNIILRNSAIGIDEVVVIGYGSLQKKDLTGSVSNLSSKDFNKGVVSSAEQLINGKAAGLQIISNSGSPNAGSTIRIRGGASLNASNDPLIVLDGVPLESGGVSGNSNNFLSLINPSDIESMTVLKDASSTAIYGSRASNGVIIITTKKGKTGKLSIAANIMSSVQTKTTTPDMLSRNEFIDVINAKGTDQQKALLGTANTNWNDEIYRTALSTDANLSISGAITPSIPFRVSFGGSIQNGLLKNDYSKRFTNSISINPSFFDNHLKLTLNTKTALTKNSFGNSDAIYAANTFNPTIPVYSGNNNYGGYNEAIDASGLPVNGGIRNPLGLVNQYESTSNVSRFITNFDIDYKMHFLPELKFHATLGYDYSEGKGTTYIPEEAAQYASTYGRDYKYGPEKNTNKLLTTYFNYNKTFNSIKSSLDATAGYDYQYWESTMSSYSELNNKNEIMTTYAAKDQRHTLLSYYGRANYTYDDRYMLTATVRKDGTSRFGKDNRWGTFPSIALAWRLSEESFLKENKVLSNLKLRASFGITGQQEGIGNYKYLPVYTVSQEGAQSQMGNQWIYTYRPDAYVSDLKWETTDSWNFGVDFGFFNDRISGGIDYYTRKTKDLLATVPAPAGTNFNKKILTNVGNVDSQGLELTLNAIPVQTQDLTWNVSFNMTWQKMKVTNLSMVKGAATTNMQVGPTMDSYYFQVLTEGYSPYMFYVYHQLYDPETGKPIEGAYADLNGDGVITSDDLYRYHSPAPDYILGFSTSLNYKKWTLSTALRANIGNYVYNGMAMTTGAFGTTSYNAFQLNNLSRSYLDTGFQSRQYLSDYYVENASFLKMDNLTLSYDLGKLWGLSHVNVSAMVQNVFCITKYSGADPEVPNGMDTSFYPRPRTYSVSLGIQF